MKNNRLKLILISFLCFVFIISSLHGARPSREAVFRMMSQDLLMNLVVAFKSLTPEQFVEMTGTRRGVKMVDGNILRYLYNNDPRHKYNHIYDSVMSHESNASQVSGLRFYLVFDLDREIEGRWLYLLENKHGHYYDHRALQLPPKIAPREIFANLCKLFELQDAYEQHKNDFVEVTEEQKRFEAAQKRESPFLNFIAAYWVLIMVLAFVIVFFTELKEMKDLSLAEKAYSVGLSMVCILITMSVVLIHYTGQPLPNVRANISLIEGTYPPQMFALGNAILLATFGWWALSIAAVFAGRILRLSIILPLTYVIVMPISLWLSEIPFAGPFKISFPLAAIVIALINSMSMKFPWNSYPAIKSPEEH